MPGRLEGKVALVTGGGWNIGRATAVAFAREGARVVIAGRTAGRLEETLAAIEASGGQGLAVPTDVTSAAATEELGERTREAFGAVDVLAAIAGGGGGGEAIDEIAPDRFNEVIQVNVIGTFHAVRAVLPGMRQRGAGSILTCTGGGAFVPMPGANATAYAAAKAALCRMTDQLALEVHGSGVRVNCLQPELTWDPDRLAEVEAQERRTCEPHPQRAQNHPPEDAAELALWLASDESAPLTGRSVSVNDTWWRDRDSVERVVQSIHAYTLRRVDADARVTG